MGKKIKYILCIRNVHLLSVVAVYAICDSLGSCFAARSWENILLACLPNDCNSFLRKVYGMTAHFCCSHVRLRFARIVSGFSVVSAQNDF